MAVGEIFKGEEFIMLAELEEDGKKIIRPFDQTDGSVTLTSDEIEIDTKDRTGSGYGKTTREISLEGLISEGDPFPDAMEKAIVDKKYVKIYELNTRDLTAKYGMYMISSFERTFSNGEFAEYSLDGTLYGEICDTVLSSIPAGAPAPDGADCEPSIEIPVEE